MAEHLIIGVDPGTTTSVAALDLKGRAVGVTSSKDMGAAAVVNYILSLGKPSLIASDVNPAPDFVAGIASKFGVTLFVPEKSLSVNDKLELTRGHPTEDAHQRDALAAALYAYYRYTNKFRKIDSLGLGAAVKHLVLQGVSISAAKDEVSGRREETPAEEGPIETVESKEISPLERRIRDLGKRVRNLLDVIEEKDDEIRALREGLAEAKRVRHMKEEVKPSSEEKRIHSLQAQLGRLREAEFLLRDVVSDAVVPVPIYPRVRGGFTLAEHKLQETGKIKVAFTSNSRVREHLMERGIAVYDSKELSEYGGIHYISRKRLEELGRPQPKTPDIEGIVSEYRRGKRL